MKWWEKTVEYYFVCNFLKLGYFAMPLDGTYEAIGDTIFIDDDRQFLLVEFKKDKASIPTEKNKFENYENFINCIYEKMYLYENNDILCDFPDQTELVQGIDFDGKIRELAKMTRFHIIVYGQLENKYLSLKYVNYYPEIEQCHGDIFYCRTKDIEKFKYYIKAFLTCKFSPDGPSGQSSARNFLSYTYIFGISKNSKHITFISLYDYLYDNSGKDRGESETNFLYI